MKQLIVACLITFELVAGQRWNQQVCNAGLLELPSYPPHQLCLGHAQDVGNLEEIDQETA